MTSKIYIIGGPRSGKSFLGKRLSEKTGINHFDLDRIVFYPNWEERDEKNRNIELDKVLRSDKWIIEGVYTENWIVPALKKADIIIWLDAPTRNKLFRFLKQIFKEKWNRKDFYGRGKLIVGLPHKEWNRSRHTYQISIHSFRDKVVVLKSRKDVNDFLKTSNY